jgi:hypothetical protein
MLFSPRGVSAGCIYAFIHVLGVLSAYHLASLLQMLLSPRRVIAACIYMHPSMYLASCLLTAWPAYF